MIRRRFPPPAARCSSCSRMAGKTCVVGLTWDGKCPDCSTEREWRFPNPDRARRRRRPQPSPSPGRLGAQTVKPLPTLSPAEMAQVVETFSGVLRATYALIYLQGLPLSEAAAVRGVEKPAVSRAAARVHARFSAAAAARRDGNRRNGQPISSTFAPGMGKGKSRAAAATDANDLVVRLDETSAQFSAWAAQRLGLENEEQFVRWILRQFSSHLLLDAPPDVLVESIRLQLRPGDSPAPSPDEMVT